MACQCASISSSDRPLVSGISFQVRYNAGEQQMPKIQKVQAEPSPSNIKGVSWPTKKFPIQRVSVARDMAFP